MRRAPLDDGDGSIRAFDRPETNRAVLAGADQARPGKRKTGDWAPMSAEFSQRRCGRYLPKSNRTVAAPAGVEREGARETWGKSRGRPAPKQRARQTRGVRLPGSERRKKRELDPHCPCVRAMGLNVTRFCSWFQESGRPADDLRPRPW